MQVIFMIRNKMTWVREIIPLTNKSSNRPTIVDANINFILFLSLHHTFWYSHISFTNRCTFIKTL